MSKIVREDNFSEEERREIAALSKAVGITELTAGILYARGQNTEEKMRRFLNPSRANFLSPFLLHGMREAVQLLTRAKEEGWQVAVFGDYDADGIGALAILYRAFGEFGIDARVYVPEREKGYGLSIEAIDMIFDDCMPDLIVTVDCGISCAKEIEYIKECGAYAIVTDHHELPEILPDCITIDPKIKGEYPYDNLCGAGVAFKLASALIGESAYKLLDFCALSTVADSVSLLGENRDIVCEGLKLISEHPRPAFSALLKEKTEISSQMLSFTLVPRVNAAGRMGDAHAAMELFLSEDEKEIAALAEKLNSYNEQRQKLCDEVYAKAKEQILKEGAFSQAIVLCGENWHAGLIGIVAARLAEEYCRPAVLFVRKNGILRGSARSIERVNIYEAIKACSGYLEEFGGHAQAAGIGLREENFSPFKAALNEYLQKKYTREDFEPSIVISGEVRGGLSRALAYELMRLEPFGVGNKRPYFLLSGENFSARPIKPLSPHLVFSEEGTDFVYFGGARDLTLLNSNVKKQLVFECNVSKFRGRENVKGFIRDVVYSDFHASDPKLVAFENTVKALGREEFEAEALGREELNERMERSISSCAYGLCAVCENFDALENFPALKDVSRSFFHLRRENVLNSVLLAPMEECDLSAYREVYFLESPALKRFQTGGAHLYANRDLSLYAPFKGMDMSRERMAKLYTFLKGKEGCAFEGSYFAAKSFEGEFSAEELVFAMAVFEELALIDFSSERIRIIRGKKTDLMQSLIYRTAVKIKEG